MTVISNHVSQDASGWTKTGVTMLDDVASLRINTVVGNSLHYVWDHSGSLTLPSSGRCVLSITIKSSDVPRIAIGTHPSDTSKELSAIFDLRNHTFAGWDGNQTTQNNTASITRSGSDWVLTANIDFGSSYGGRSAVMHIWLLDGTTGTRQSWAASSVQSVNMRNLSLGPPGATPTPQPPSGGGSSGSSSNPLPGSLSALPLPLAAGYSVQAVDMTVRTEMDVGLPRVRRRSAASYYHVTAQWQLTDAQLSDFDSWWRGSGRGGAVWVNIGLKIHGAQALYNARFLQPPKITLKQPGVWRLAGKLEVRG